jgi:hypothetical protein
MKPNLFKIAADIKAMADDLPDHFLMGPSSASMWIPCPGMLRRRHPTDDELGKDMSAADRGTLGHHMVEARLTAVDAACDEFRYADWLGYHDYDFLMSFDNEERLVLCEAVNMCVDFVLTLQADGFTVFSELKIPDDFLIEHGGTVDIIAIKGDVMYVVDFKFGQRGVKVEDNKQVKSYINLVRQYFGTFKTIIGVIIQPAVAGVIQFEFPIDELNAHAVDVIRSSVSNELQAGTHCEFCPLKSSCSTNGAYIVKMCQEEFPDLTKMASTIGRMPTDDEADTLAKMYLTGKIASKICDDAGTLIKTYTNRGYDFSPFGLSVRKKVIMNYAGADPAVSAAAIAAEFKLSPDQYMTEPSAITPAALRAVVGLQLPDFRKRFANQLDLQERQHMHTGKVGREDLPEFDDLTNPAT